jgi:hypothetical protein
VETIRYCPVCNSILPFYRILAEVNITPLSVRCRRCKTKLRIKAPLWGAVLYALIFIFGLLASVPLALAVKDLLPGEDVWVFYLTSFALGILSALAAARFSSCMAFWFARGYALTAH